MPTDASHHVVTTTTDSEETAATLARSVVEARLGACVQVVPIRSCYRWKGKVRDEPEWRLEIKTGAAQIERLVAHIRAHHSYDLPEIIATPVVAGDPAYLQWLDEETRPG